MTKRWQDPYGGDRGTPASNWPDKHGFLGGYQNTTGVTHVGARDYDPLAGRFMTADPVLDTSNPQALNAYSYGNNSPVSFSDPTGMILQIDGRPAYIGTDAMSTMGAEAWDRAFRYNAGVARNWFYAVTHKTRPTYPGFVGRENHLMSPKQRRAKWETEFANWSLQPPDHRPQDCDQFAAAFCSEFPDVRACDPSPPSLEETLEVVGLLASIPTGAWLARLGGEAVAGAIAGIEGSVEAGGAVAAGAGAGALGDYSGYLVAAKITAEAVGGDSAAATCMNSFTGNTPVLTADGTSKPIDEVKVGDVVRNAEPDSSSTEQHVVTAVHVTDDDHDFVRLTVLTSDGSRTIVTTAHHPFWNATSHTWTDAADLTNGDQLATPGDGRVVVRRLLRYTASDRTYNLTVENVHTYYVLAGTTPVLVHNCAAPAIRISPAASDWATKGAHMHVGSSEVRIFPTGDGGVGFEGLRMSNGTASARDVETARNAIMSTPELRADLIGKARSAMADMNDHNWGNSVNRASEMNFLIKALEKIG
ncbi:polymorphic toxin-type HINT domain-containing protein [Amycolatopsis sp. NPDC004378]